MGGEYIFLVLQFEGASLIERVFSVEGVMRTTSPLRYQSSFASLSGRVFSSMLSTCTQARRHLARGHNIRMRPEAILVCSFIFHAVISCV